MFTQGQSGPKGDMVSIPYICQKHMHYITFTTGQPLVEPIKREHTLEIYTNKPKQIRNNCIEPCFAVKVS